MFSIGRKVWDLWDPIIFGKKWVNGIFVPYMEYGIWFLYHTWNMVYGILTIHGIYGISIYLYMNS